MIRASRDGGGEETTQLFCYKAIVTDVDNAIGKIDIHVKNMLWSMIYLRCLDNIIIIETSCILYH